MAVDQPRHDETAAGVNRAATRVIGRELGLLSYPGDSAAIPGERGIANQVDGVLPAVAPAGGQHADVGQRGHRSLARPELVEGRATCSWFDTLTTSGVMISAG
jgi:hypothetical protein